MMKEATALRKAAPKMAAPLSVHAYYPAAAAEDEENTPLPEGASVVHLRLGKDGTQILHEAQLADTERFHNVPMGTIAAAAMGIARRGSSAEGEGREVRGHTVFWDDTTRSTVKLMYTPVASQRRHEVQQMEDGGDATRKMVVVVPKGVKLKVSNAEDHVQWRRQKPAWMEAEMDLRKDIIMMCHDMAHHPKRAPITACREAHGHLDWQRIQVREHIDSCADCLEERKAVAEIGAGIVAAGRGDVMQMDHYVLSKDEAAMAGVPVVLTICDVATG